jgi:hypothetical protein
MQHFTQEDFQPSKSAILFVKQFARIYSNNKAGTPMAQRLN